MDRLCVLFGPVHQLVMDVVGAFRTCTFGMHACLDSCMMSAGPLRGGVPDRRGLYWSGTPTPLGPTVAPSDRLASAVAGVLGTGPADITRPERSESVRRDLAVIGCVAGPLCITGRVRSDARRLSRPDWDKHHRYREGALGQPGSPLAQPRLRRQTDFQGRRQPLQRLPVDGALLRTAGG